jgi:hypothetical protein
MLFTTLFSLIYFCKHPLLCIYIDLERANVYTVKGVVALVKKVLLWGVEGCLARMSNRESVVIGAYVFLEYRHVVPELY